MSYVRNINYFLYILSSVVPPFSQQNTKNPVNP